MKEKICPKCKTVTLSIAEKCVCGYDFISHDVRKSDESLNTINSKRGLFENESGYILSSIIIFLILGLNAAINGFNFYVNNEIVFACISFCVAGVVVACTLGLFKIKKWAYFTSLGLASFIIICNIFYLINLGAFRASLLFPVFALIYLLFVKNIFVKKS